MIDRPGFALLLILLSVYPAFAREPINCSINLPEQLTQQCSSDKTYRASQFNQCIDTELLDPSSCLILDKSAQFCSNSRKSTNLTILLDSNDVSLDCNGVVIDHGSKKPGTQPVIRTVKNRSLSNVAIKNCTIQNTTNLAIDLGRSFAGQLIKHSLPQGHSNIQIDNVRINNVHTGIFIGPYSSQITLNRVKINLTQRIAVYSEAGTHELIIKHSEFAENQSRESIALDSTYNSSIEHSFFYDNKEGAIASYTNCGELKGIVCPVVRSTGANNNQIHGNVFSGNNKFSINIAARQGRRHAAGWCSTLDGQAGRHLDESKNNVIFANDIRCTNGIGILISDGPNYVLDNTITAYNSCKPLKIGSGEWWIAKDYLHKNSVISNNQLRRDNRIYRAKVPPDVILENNF